MHLIQVGNAYRICSTTSKATSGRFVKSISVLSGEVFYDFFATFARILAQPVYVVSNCSNYETEFPQAAIEFVLFLLLLLAASISGYSVIQYRIRGTTDA